MRPAADVTLDSATREYETPAGPVHAVDGIVLRVEPGQRVAITGPSGCGKSTLLGLIAGLEAPTAGSVSIGGVELSALKEAERVALRRTELGLIFQADNLLPFLTALENVALQLALADTGAGPERSLELLAGLGLADHLHKLPDQLSGGQRQRVAVAGALIGEPTAILADEPTGSLDADNSRAVIDLLLEASRETGATLLVVTHDPAVAERMDVTVRLRDGRLAEPVPPQLREREPSRA
jgi:putative ABC transport system ATP-binding protein